MVPAEAVYFAEALGSGTDSDGFDKIYAAVSNIDGRRAQAYLKSDQRMIIGAVLETVRSVT